MPQVPRIERQVQEVGIPTVRAATDAPTEAFGGGRSLDRVTDETRALAQTSIEIYAKERQRADEIAVRDADISAADISNNIESKVRELRGRDAAAAPDLVEKEWKKETEKINASLSNDAQRIRAQQIFRARRSQLDESTQFHMAGEFKRYDAEQHDNAMKTYRDSGSMKYTRPGAIDGSIIQQDAEIDRFAERNSMPEEWRQRQKAEARSATHRDVLERMLVDGNDQLAKAYEKKINKFILPDDVAILEKVRREEKERKAARDSELQRQAYLAISDSAARDEDKIRIVDNLLRSGSITLPQSVEWKGWITKSFNDPDILTDDKVNKHYEAVEKLKELGIEIDKRGNPATASEGNSFQDIQKTRKWLAENKGYFSRDFYQKAIESTEADYDAANAPKRSLFKSLMDVLPLLPNLSGPAQMDLMTKGMDIFKKDMPVQQAAENIAKLKEQAVVSGNPNRTKYAVGDIITNARGEKAEVIRFDPRTGDPVLKVLK